MKILLNNCLTFILHNQSSKQVLKTYYADVISTKGHQILLRLCLYKIRKKLKRKNYHMKLK